MERQRQETVARLQADGVFEMNRELELPVVIQRLAVVSSRNAAGYQDFCNELSDSPYRFEVTLFDAFMQGAGAEDSIIEALGAVADRADDFDAVVVIRGGGSQSDLGCFDSYRLCSHIAQFPLPVIAGIGHDKDQSVADLVAAVSVKTPTAVAVYLKEEAGAFDGWLEERLDELSGAALTLLDNSRQQLRQAAVTLKMGSSDRMHDQQLQLGRLHGDLIRLTGQVVYRGLADLRNLDVRLSQASRYNLGCLYAESRCDARCFGFAQYGAAANAAAAIGVARRPGSCARSPAYVGDGFCDGAVRRTAYHLCRGCATGCRDYRIVAGWFGRCRNQTAASDREEFPKGKR